MAQATFAGCRHSGDSLGRPYCEFRDEPGDNNATGLVSVGPRGRKAYRVEILDATGGPYSVSFQNLWAYADLSIETTGETEFGFSLSAGDNRDSTGYISGIPQYSKGTVGPGTITIDQGTTVVASCTVNIVDDDNKAYIGQRRHHPYGGTWQRSPKCHTTPGCGWQ